MVDSDKAAASRTRALRIFILSACCMLSTGAQYSLSAWSPELKKQLGLTQSGVETFGMVGNIGSYLGPLTGIIAYALPPWATGLACVGFNLVGFLPLALAVRDDSGLFSQMRDPGVLGMFFSLGGFGASLLYYLLITVNLNNMPANRRGICVATMATVMGASAGLFVLAYNGPLEHNVSNMMLTFAVVPAVASLLAAVFVRPVDPSVGWPLEQFALLDEENRHESSLNSSPGSRTSPIASPHHGRSVYPSLEPTDSTGLVNPASLPSDEADDEEFDAEERAQRVLQEQEQQQMDLQDATCGGGLAGKALGAILFLVRSSTYWILVVLFFLVTGAGLMIINNTGHIVQSLNGGEQDRDFVTVLIIMLSLCNAVGRLAMGLSDLFRWRRGVWLIGACVLMAVMHFLFAFVFTTKGGMMLGVIGVGLAYGAIWSVGPIILQDNFGRKNFGMNFGWVSCATSPASFFFNYWAGHFYELETPEGTTECVGVHCFRATFVLCAVSSTLAAVIALVLMLPRTQPGKKAVRPGRRGKPLSKQENKRLG